MALLKVIFDQIVYLYSHCFVFVTLGEIFTTKRESISHTYYALQCYSCMASREDIGRPGKEWLTLRRFVDSVNISM